MVEGLSFLIFLDNAICLIETEFTGFAEVSNTLGLLVSLDTSQTTIVVSLCKMLFELNSTRIVIDSTLEVMTQGIEITSIIVEIGVLGRKVNGIREITKNVSRLKFDIRALGCIELIDLRLTAALNSLTFA